MLFESGYRYLCRTRCDECGSGETVSVSRGLDATLVLGGDVDWSDLWWFSALEQHNCVLSRTHRFFEPLLV